VPSQSSSARQGAPQAPQLSWLVSVLTQVSAQSSRPGGSAGQAHSPWSQRMVASQALPQRPQLSRSVSGSTQAVPHWSSPG